MAIDNDTSYELTGAQIKDLAQKIRNKADDNTFVGAGTSVAGSRGLVPAPAAGDDGKFLKGDGTWGVVAADSGWQVATLTSNFAAYNSSVPAAQYRKIGSIVQIKGVVTPTETIPGSSTRIVIFTLPNGYRPSSTLDFICQGSGIAKWHLSVNANGTVDFSRYGVTAFEDCSTNNWLPFSATFFVN